MPKKPRKKAKRVECSISCPDGLKGLLTPIENIREHPHNVKIGHSVKAIATSLGESGWHAPIVANREGLILVGNGRYLASRRLGEPLVPVLFVDDDDRQSVRRMVMDNRSGEFSMWDVDEINHFATDLSGLENMFQLDEFIVTDPVVPSLEDDEPKDEGAGLKENNPKLKKFIDAREKSRARGADKADTNFWLCLVFQSLEQKKAFLERIGNPPTKYDMYADGQAFAESIGIDITKNEQKPIQSPLDQKLSGLVDS